MNEPTRRFARPITRRSSTFPFRNARFWDATEFGGGFIRITGAPGAVRVGEQDIMDLRTGEVITRLDLPSTEGERA